jgi:ABC-2 type transport system ATP-binding protein
VPDSVVVYIKDGSAAIPRIVLMMNRAEVLMEEVTLARPTLDDVFLQKTGHHLEVGATADVPEGRK